MCSDMAQTVDFYNGVLDMPLVYAAELDGGAQRFSFDVGRGQRISFFWDPQGGPANPPPPSMFGPDGGLNHVAMAVDLPRIKEYWEKLQELGVDGHVGAMYMPGSEAEAATAKSRDGSPWIWVHTGKPFPSIDEIILDEHDIATVEIGFKDPDGIGLEFTADFPERVTEAAKKLFGVRSVTAKSRPVGVASRP
jgi:catechol 2,3-dioxygenase-like lactoylglutathione lyase family enzyme